MRIWILIIWIIWLPFSLSGQLQALTGHYSINNLAINPAVSGSDEALSISMAYRNQWVGIEGAPNTAILTIHTPLLNEKIGLGLMLLHDNIGITSETSVIGNYAFRFNVASGKLAFGLGFGLTFFNEQWNKLDATNIDDEYIIEDNVKAIRPEFSFGLFYYSKKYFIGFSIPLFLSYNTDIKTGKMNLQNNISEYGYFVNGGYIIKSNSEIKFIPSILLKYHTNNASQIDLNALVILKNKLGVGATYRSNNVIVGLLQCQVNNQLKIAYTYDFNISGTSRFNNGSHEISMNYRFNYNIDIPGPRQF
ncbi:MAG: type IX secretion system membrane protein PorP/SprF [Bacteroidales bacterium]|nr:type IX secretion system membrane protein PorP/SprF [Bacteroidales bacterium]